MDDRAFVAESSMCGGIARTAVAVGQNAEPKRHNRGISHAWSSCMRITPKADRLSEGKPVFSAISINRISLPIPKFRLSGEIQVPIPLNRVSCGTELSIMQEGVPCEMLASILVAQ